MLKEASGCCEGVSGCTEEESGCAKRASGYIRLPAQEWRTERWNFDKIWFLNTPFEENLGISSLNEARNNAITNKQIETQRIEDLTQIKIRFLHCVYIFIVVYTFWS